MLQISGRDFAKSYGATFHEIIVTRSNYKNLLENSLNKGDFLLNLSVGISNKELVEYCLEKGILYLDASTEPWEGGYTDINLPVSLRKNYALREDILKLKSKKGATAVLTHGANPGLVSNFLKQALCNLAIDSGLFLTRPVTENQWAKLAQQLGIRVIHIAERDASFY